MTEGVTDKHNQWSDSGPIKINGDVKKGRDLQKHPLCFQQLENTEIYGDYVLAMIILSPIKSKLIFFLKIFFFLKCNVIFE